MKILSSNQQTKSKNTQLISEGRFQVAAGAVIEDLSSGKILLLQRKSDDKLRPNGYEPIYGRLKQGEELEHGLLREIKEETGLTQVEVVQQISYWHIYRGEKIKQNEVIGLTFWCQTDHQTEITLSLEHQAYLWVEPAEALNMIKHSSIKEDLEKCLLWREKQMDLQKALTREQRSLADYQNLLRRVTQEKAHLLDHLSMQVIEPLLVPFEHLSLASKQIKDKGLEMVMSELKQALLAMGLVEFNPLGETFDAQTMSAVKKQGEGNKVVDVVKLGFLFNGKVLQHAQVIVG